MFIILPLVRSVLSVHSIVPSGGIIGWCSLYLDALSSVILVSLPEPEAVFPPPEAFMPSRASPFSPAGGAAA